MTRRKNLRDIEEARQFIKEHLMEGWSYNSQCDRCVELNDKLMKLLEAKDDN